MDQLYDPNDLGRTTPIAPYHPFGYVSPNVPGNNLTTPTATRPPAGLGVVMSESVELWLMRLGMDLDNANDLVKRYSQGKEGQ